jgi:hypothetical protein
LPPNKITLQVILLDSMNSSAFVIAIFTLVSISNLSDGGK